MSNDYGPSDERRREIYGDRPEPRPSKSLWMLFGGVGCIVVLGCGGLIVAGVLWASKTFTTDLPAATAAANEFLDLLQQNRIDDAYAKTGSEFKAHQPREQFHGFVKQFDSFAKSTSREINSAWIVQGGKKQAFVQMTLKSPNKSMTCTLQLVHENGVWKVEALNVRW